MSQLITTPGNVQQAVINVNGSLQYVAELLPYNWDPASSGGMNPTFSTNCKPNKICPVYQPRYGHNILYGGLGGGVMRGGDDTPTMTGGVEVHQSA